jgi:hypothetical protein
MQSAPYNPKNIYIYSPLNSKKIFTYIGSSLFFTGEILPESETILFLKINKFEGLHFAVNKSEGKNNFKKSPDSYVRLSLCSQTCKRITKDFIVYFWCIARLG